VTAGLLQAVADIGPLFDSSVLSSRGARCGPQWRGSLILAGTGVQGASARLLVAVDGHHGHLAIAGVRPLPLGRTYQLWFIPASAPPVTGGTFAVDAGGRAWATISVPIPLDDARVIAITEEPSSGSMAPTGNYLLEARAWR
jgi:anti-sigma-K factor RskA